MRTLSPVLILLLIVSPMSGVFGQVPGAGFESWAVGAPEGWVTSNAPPVYTNVTQSADAHSGSSAVRGDAIGYYTVVLGATIQSGPGGHGFAYANRPASVTGWYKFFQTGGDRFGVNVALYKGGEGGTVVALAASADSTQRSNYTQFNVPFNYLTSDVPDLCIMQFSTALPYLESSLHVGTYFLLDDVDLSGTTDVAANDARPAAFELSQNYPNPFNPTTVISCQLPAAGNVRLAVYDLLGREMAVVAQGMMTAGRHEFHFDASLLSSGTYLYRLEAPNGVAVRKMTLLR
jgi:hypothetical protein